VDALNFSEQISLVEAGTLVIQSSSNGATPRVDRKVFPLGLMVHPLCPKLQTVLRSTSTTSCQRTCPRGKTPSRFYRTSSPRYFSEFSRGALPVLWGPWCKMRGAATLLPARKFAKKCRMMERNPLPQRGLGFLSAAAGCHSQNVVASPSQGKRSGPRSVLCNITLTQESCISILYAIEVRDSQNLSPPFTVLSLYCAAAAAADDDDDDDMMMCTRA
jgi:hypothetical protein